MGFRYPKNSKDGKWENLDYLKIRILRKIFTKWDLRKHFQKQRWWNSRWHVVQRWPCMPCKSGSHGLILPYLPFDASSPHRGCQDHEQQHRYITRCLSRLYRSQRRWKSASATFASHEYQGNLPECAREVLNGTSLSYMKRRKPSLSLTDSSSRKNTEERILLHLA